MLSLARCFGFSKHLLSRPRNISVRSFVTSSSTFQPRRTASTAKEFEDEGGRRTTSVLEEDMDELAEQWDDTPDIVDTPSGGHIMLQQFRQTLHYLRLIEHELPKLVGVFLLYSNCSKNVH